MRTTLTIDEDVSVLLRRWAGRRGLPFKEAVNTALRKGLLALEEPPRRKPYRTRARSLGAMPGVDYDKVGQLADELDDRARLGS